MYHRAGRRGATIRGPQSALTDFLASHNISAHQIQQDHLRRHREAQQQAGQENNNADDNKENESDPGDEDPAERKKRTRKEEKAIMKIKQSKEFKRRKTVEKSKKRQRGSEDDDDEDGNYDDDTIARSMLYKKSQPLQGQFENCEICEKRFTVTTYSKTGPDGGLLCTKCSKELGKEEKKQQPKKRGPHKVKRRQTESDRMMGDVKLGAKSLLETCVRNVATNIVDIEEFGDLPQSLLDRLSQVLSQKRVLDPRTLELFLQPDSTRIAIYDGAKLETDDYEKIFSFMPELEDVNLRNAGQMKDGVLKYMLDHNPKIRHFQLGAGNLITNSGWQEFFKAQGPVLESFKTSDLDAAMDDETISTLVHHCPRLRRLKLKKCWLTTESTIESLTSLTNLTHLSLSTSPETAPTILADLVTTLGHPLETLSLESFHHADDTLLSAIHDTCTRLTKLRLTNNTLFTDAGFAHLFNSWPNPPLLFLDLSDNRSIDNAHPDGTPDSPVIGFASSGFAAAMSHSGPALQRLNIKACRHISHDTLLSVFNPDEHVYPELRDLDTSFVAQVDEVVVSAIFKCCPKLEKLAVFGCKQVRDVRVPGGVAVIGMMNAQQSVVVEGEFWG